MKESGTMPDPVKIIPPKKRIKKIRENFYELRDRFLGLN